MLVSVSCFGPRGVIKSHHTISSEIYRQLVKIQSGWNSMFPSVWFGYLLHFTHSLLAREDGVGPNIIKSKHASLSRE